MQTSTLHLGLNESLESSNDIGTWRDRWRLPKAIIIGHKKCGSSKFFNKCMVNNSQKSKFVQLYLKRCNMIIVSWAGGGCLLTAILISRWPSRLSQGSLASDGYLMVPLYMAESNETNGSSKAWMAVRIKTSSTNNPVLSYTAYFNYSTFLNPNLF